MERGWIRLWRKLQDSAVWQDPHLLRLFEWCLFNANYKEGWVKVEGVVDPVKVERGQFITGRHSLNRKLYPRQREKDPSPSTTWRWLLSLQKGQYLHLQMNNRFTIVTVCNYDTYNPPETENGQPNEPPADSRRTAGGQPVDTEKKEKKVKKEKKKRAGARFVLPTLEEVTAYCRERGKNVNPQKWFNHYSANGWRVGKNPMKDWKAAVRTWEDNEFNPPSSPQTPRIN